MPNTKSAKKRERQRIKRTLRNKHIRSTYRTFVKRVRYAIERGDKETVKKYLPIAISKIDWAWSKGVIHKNKAARLKSRLMIQANKLLAGE